MIAKLTRLITHIRPNEKHLPIALSLAILSPEAISSVAYATEEMQRELIHTLNHQLIWDWTLILSILITVLLCIVSSSYRQVIKAYPEGGGSFAVAYANLGRLSGLITGGALMTSYIMSVTVGASVCSETLRWTARNIMQINIDEGWRITLCIAIIIFLTVINLAGLRFLSIIVSPFFYMFVLALLCLIGFGFFQHIWGTSNPFEFVNLAPEAIDGLGDNENSIFKAFVVGCTALTGIEAISSSLSIFKPGKKDQTKNPRLALVICTVLLGCMFIGVSYLAVLYKYLPIDKYQERLMVSHSQTIITALSNQILSGENNYLSYAISLIAVPMMLMLAANTSFNEFPRLCSHIANHNYMPRQLTFLRDRFVFSHGVFFLSGCAICIVLISGGKSDFLIPLYTFGMFIAFTLSQFGMVMYWFNKRTTTNLNWKRRAGINAVGGLITMIVAITIGWIRWKEGSLMVLVLIFGLVIFCLMVYDHYQKHEIHFAPKMKFTRSRQNHETSNAAIVLVCGFNQGTIAALDYACSIANKVTAIHLDISFADACTNDDIMENWHKFVPEDIKLVDLNSKSGSVIENLVNLIKKTQANDDATVIIPTLHCRNRWERFLHNHSSLFIRNALLKNGIRTVSNVNYGY